MDYTNLGRTGLKVSRLCLGTMTFGWSADEGTSFEIMDAAFSAGINFFDTADIYSYWVDGNTGGESEAIIGRWLKTRNRRDVVIATKVRGPMWEGPNGQGLSRHHIIHAVEDSLRRLDTDYIDLYQTHWPDHETPLEETLRVLKAVREADPDIIVNSRVTFQGTVDFRDNHFGDYKSTGDRAVIYRQVEGPWESYPTTNESYGYHAHDHSHKTPDYLIKVLARAAAKGGNVMLNMGPMGNGQIDPVDLVERVLQKRGRDLGRVDLRA